MSLEVQVEFQGGLLDGKKQLILDPLPVLTTAGYEYILCVRTAKSQQRKVLAAYIEKHQLEHQDQRCARVPRAGDPEE